MCVAFSKIQRNGWHIMLRIVDPDARVPFSIIKVFKVTCPTCGVELTSMGHNTIYSCPLCGAFVPDVIDIMDDAEYRMIYHTSGI